MFIIELGPHIVLHLAQKTIVDFLPKWYITSGPHLNGMSTSWLRYTYQKLSFEAFRSKLRALNLSHVHTSIRYAAKLHIVIGAHTPCETHSVLLES